MDDSKKKIIGRIKDIIAGIENPTDPLYGIMTPTSPVR